MIREIRRTIKLYESSVDKLPLIQGDTTLLILTLFGKDNQPVTPSSVRLNAVRSDRAPFIQTDNIDITNNVLTILLNPDIVAVPGTLKLELKFPDVDTMISSYIFDGAVSPSLIPGLPPPTPPGEVMRLITSSQITHIWIGTQSDYNSMQHNDQTLYFIEG